MSWTKEDLSFKTLLNKRVTSSGKAFYEEVGDDTFNAHLDQLWIDSISATPATAVSDGVAVERALFTLTEDTSVANQQCYYAYESGERLKYWISDKYGSGYIVHLFDNNNNEIYATDSSAWLFSYQTGILIFNGSTSSFAKPFKITGYRYIGGKGVTGLQGVPDFDGSTGPQGVTGLVGVTGLRGTTGSQGVTGLIGLTGSQGVTGVFDRTILTDTREPTGFLSPENITVTYDSSARTITLTGASITLYWRGTKVWNDLTTWTSDPHGNTNGSWYLYYNGSAFVWANSIWTFDMAQIAYVYFGSTNKFALREVHGLMEWETHQELHRVIGTYRVSGGALNGYILPPTTDAQNRPGVDLTNIADEDLPTEVPLLADDGPYTQLYLVGAGAVATIVTGALNIAPISAGIIAYNQLTGGAWQQTQVPAGNSYTNVWLIALPVTLDVGSQTYRYLWMQGQAVYNSLAGAQAEDPRQISFGTFASNTPEFVITTQITIRRVGALTGSFQIQSVRTVFGSRTSPAAFSIGPQGETGISGITGLVGLTGFQGTQGVTGLIGVTGSNGYTGLQGSTGIKGLGPYGDYWVSQLSPADYTWNSICYGNGLFVAVAQNGGFDQVMTSSDGVSWALRTLSASETWYNVCYGNGKYVAVTFSGSSNRSMVSTEGINWTANDIDDSLNNWVNVVYGNGVFVATSIVGSDPLVAVSSDGTTWSLYNAAANNFWYGLCFGDGKFVAVSSTGTSNSRAMYSTNGTTWSQGTSAGDYSWLSVAYGNGKYVAVATEGYVMYSSDGASWSLVTAPIASGWCSIAFGNGLFIAVAKSGTGNRTMHSIDAITWYTQPAVAQNAWQCVCYGAGLYVAVATSGTGNRVMTSGVLAPRGDTGLQGTQGVTGLVGVGVTGLASSYIPYYSGSSLLNSNIRHDGDGIVVGIPSGGFKGTGTINAQAVYDDNVLLTGYVIDKMYSTDFSIDTWDKKVGKEHKQARRYLKDYGVNTNIDEYGRYLKENKCLPTFEDVEKSGQKYIPSMGEMIQKLWEVVEIQAIHIQMLNERIKKIELP